MSISLKRKSKAIAEARRTIMVAVILLLSFVILPFSLIGCLGYDGPYADARYAVGDTVTVAQDEQTGVVKHIFSSSRNNTRYNIRFPLKHGGYSDIIVYDWELK